MTRSTTSASGSRQRAAVGLGLSSVREVLDQLRSPAGQPAGPRSEHGEVRGAVLQVLAEQPADGYRIVRLLEERGDGDRTPGAGAVYPMLQLLADEGLATAADEDGRKTWTLTVAGRAAAEAKVARERSDGRSAAAGHGTERRGAILRSGGQLAQAVALAAQSATPGQVGEVVAVLDDARRRVLAILARG